MRTLKTCLKAYALFTKWILSHYFQNFILIIFFVVNIEQVPGFMLSPEDIVVNDIACPFH